MMQLRLQLARLCVISLSAAVISARVLSTHDVTHRRSMCSRCDSSGDMPAIRLLRDQQL